MREIKFRAWETISASMLCFEELLKNDIAMILKSKKQTNVKLMQFTGLKDKNGKEIYEGDIVETEKWIRIGKYARCKGVIVYKGAKYTIDCFGDWDGSDTELNGLATIIGNIYENPELLQS